MISSLKCKKRQQRKSHSKIAIGYFQQQQRLEFMKEVPFWQQSKKKQSKSLLFSKKRSSVETHEFSGGKRERVPGSNSAALALDSQKKSTTTAADKRNFGKGPLLRNSPKKWKKTSSVCSYLRQRAEHRARQRAEPINAVSPSTLGSREPKCQQHYIF